MIAASRCALPEQPAESPKSLRSADTRFDLASHAGAAFFCHELESITSGRAIGMSILVAGCGAGHEAAAIQNHLMADVEAIDIENFVPESLKEASPVRFSVGSVCDLPFEDQCFDAVFFHHVIEHVDDPSKSLVELTRVLRPGGWLFVGTPNRHRLFSSIGAHQQSEWDATLANKLTDNLRDWRDRLTGRFRNELGAHAGFARTELDRMLSQHFDTRLWLTEKYLKFKYSEHRFRALVKLAIWPTWSWFTAPAIYVFCQKPQQTQVAG